FEQLFQIYSANGSPAFLIQAVGIVDQPPGGSCQQPVDLFIQMPFTVIGSVCRGGQPDQAGIRQRVKAVAPGAERPDDTRQPGFDFGRRGVVRNVENGLLSLEILQFPFEDVQTASDGTL